MNTVKREQLTGYRTPDETEKTAIYKYVTEDIRKVGKMQSVLKAVYSCIGAFLLLGLAGVGVEPTAGEKIVIGVMVLLIVILLFGVNKSRKENKLYLKRIEQGEFQVLDCMAYKVDTTTDMVNKAMVYICTQQGQYCEEHFVADYLSVQEWHQTKTGGFLLMKAKRGKDVYYELFTDRKLGWR